jgi:hypothetical protein
VSNETYSAWLGLLSFVAPFRICHLVCLVALNRWCQRVCGSYCTTPLLINVFPYISLESVVSTGSVVLIVLRLFLLMCSLILALNRWCQRVCGSYCTTPLLINVFPYISLESVVSTGLWFLLYYASSY